MGWTDAFAYSTPAEIFREHAALSGIAGGFGKDFDISTLACITDSAFDALAPTRWPITEERQGGRFFADGQFFHADRKARILPVQYKAPAAKTGRRYPFRLNTGRVRDQWHTMTRTGLSARLSSHLAEPYLEIHPTDAAELGIWAADLVEVKSPHGACILRANITSDVTPGQVFAPMHWTAQNAPSARIDALVAGAVDPVSGQPESKASIVSVERLQAAWYGFAVATQAPVPNSDYWALARTEAGYRVELAGRQFARDWEETARAMFDLPHAQVMSVTDPARDLHRLAFHEDGHLLAALFVAPEPVAVMRDYLTTRPGQPIEQILTGRSPADVPDPGPVLCSCFGVGINTIIRAVEQDGLMRVEDIGQALRAGTNCGSCKPEIANLLKSLTLPHAAQ